MQEPRRLWRRNFVSSPLFLLYVFLQMVKGKDFRTWAPLTFAIEPFRRPLHCPMQNSENHQVVVSDSVGNKIGGAGDDEFPGFLFSARVAHAGLPGQVFLDHCHYPEHKLFGRQRFVLLDMAADGLEVGDGSCRPVFLHSGMAFSSALSQLSTHCRTVLWSMRRSWSASSRPASIAWICQDSVATNFFIASIAQ